MADRELAVSHPIGEAGRFRLITASGTVRIDGRRRRRRSHVRARYRCRPARHRATEDPEHDGVVGGRPRRGELRVGCATRGGSGLRASLDRLSRQDRPTSTSRSACRARPRSPGRRLGDGELRDLRGEQELHTVSGDLELTRRAAGIRVTTVSGDVAIRGDVLALPATTTSGDIAVDAELVEQFAARAVSGDIERPRGARAGPVHTFESVSGDLQLATRRAGLGHRRLQRPVRATVGRHCPTRRELRDGRAGDRHRRWLGAACGCGPSRAT